MSSFFLTFFSLFFIIALVKIVIFLLLLLFYIFIFFPLTVLEKDTLDIWEDYEVTGLKMLYNKSLSEMFLENVFRVWQKYLVLFLGLLMN